MSEVEIKDNRTNMEKLDFILENRGENKYEDRELHEEEKTKMEEWKNEIDDQNKIASNIGKNLKILKAEAKNIGKQIDDVGKNVKKTKKMADNTEKNLKTTNAKLKDLLVKVRSGDKICIDFVLICVCLGLVVVLYNLIKNRINADTEPKPETK